MTGQDGHDDALKQERIRARAYMIWEAEGRPDGHDLAHWLRATEEIEAEDDMEAELAAEQSEDVRPRERPGRR